MTFEELVVGSREQTLTLLNGYSADIKFDPFYHRWYYNLYQSGTLLFAGVSLTPDTLPLEGMTDYYLACIERNPDKKEYEPFDELGGILALVEVTE